MGRGEIVFDFLALVRDGIYDTRRFNFQFLPADARPTSSTPITPFSGQGLSRGPGHRGILAYPPRRGKREQLERTRVCTHKHTYIYPGAAELSRQRLP